MVYCGDFVFNPWLGKIKIFRRSILLRWCEQLIMDVIGVQTRGLLTQNGLVVTASAMDLEVPVERFHTMISRSFRESILLFWSGGFLFSLPTKRIPFKQPIRKFGIELFFRDKTSKGKQKQVKRESLSILKSRNSWSLPYQEIRRGGNHAYIIDKCLFKFQMPTQIETSQTWARTWSRLHFHCPKAVDIRYPSDSFALPMNHTSWYRIYSTP